MDFYGINVKGEFHLQQVSSLPTWDVTDEGRFLYNSTTHSLYFSDNVGWNSIASTGSISGSGVAGRLAVWTETTETGSFADLVFDDSTSRLGIGVASPEAAVHAYSATGPAGMFTTTDSIQVRAYNSSLANGTRVGYDFRSSMDNGTTIEQKTVASIESVLTGRTVDTYNTQLEFKTGVNGATPTTSLAIDPSGNIIIGTAIAGASIEKGLVLSNGTVPTASAINSIQLYASDVSTSSTLHVYQENDSVVIFPSSSGTLALTSDLTLENLSDVKDSLSPTENQSLKYNSGSGKWEARDSISALTDLSDVSVTPTTGHILRYSAGAWSSEAPTWPTALPDLSDVLTAMTPTDGQYLIYNNSSSKWEATTPSLVTAIDDLTDVAAGSPAEDHVLVFRNGTSKWTSEAMSSAINVRETIDELDDVDTTTAAPSSGDNLSWNGTNWVPLTPRENLPDLDDVYSSIAPTNNQVLSYNTSQTRWEAASLSAIGVDLITDLSDVDTVSVSPTNGDNLNWNGTNWVPLAPSYNTRENLPDLDDVYSSIAPTNNQVLGYNTSQTRWEAMSLSTIGVDSLTDLSDVDLSAGGLADGMYMVYENSSSTWKHTAFTQALQDMSDVGTLSPTTGQVLTFNGTVWDADDPVAVSTINDLTDVVITSVTDSQVLTYDNGTSKWVNLTLPAGVTALAGLSDVDNSLSPSANEILIYSGSQWEAGANVSILNDLTDVNLTVAPTNTQILRFDSGTSKWLASDESTGVTQLSELNDIDNSLSPSDGEYLVYDSGTSKWITGSPAGVTAIADLSDVTFGSAPANGEVLTYNGTVWDSAAIALDIDDLTNVDLTTPATNGQGIIWNSTAGKWEAGEVGGGAGGLSNAYDKITDGTTTTTATGSDTFKLRSSDGTISILVINDDATHGDVADFTLTANLVDLTDVDAGMTPSTNDILTFNGSVWTTGLASDTLLGYGENGTFTNGNTVTGTDSIAIGDSANANKRGQLAFSNSRFSANGDCQSSKFLVRNSTTDATETELFLNGSSERLTISDNTAWFFDIKVLAKRTDSPNESAAYTFTGCIDRNSGTTSLVGSTIKTIVAEDSVAWDVVVEADDTNDALVIKVTGESAKTVQWVAFVQTVETF